MRSRGFGLATRCGNVAVIACGGLFRDCLVTHHARHVRAAFLGNESPTGYVNGVSAMNTMSSYSPLQQLSLTRYGRLKMLHRDVLPKLDPSDFRVKLTLKALFSTYQDLHELGLAQEARLLNERRLEDEAEAPNPEE
jgi:hypothetical protein